jgi:hypothetical protein
MANETLKYIKINALMIIMKKCAICLRGAISKVTHKFMYPNGLYDNGAYVNFMAVYNSIMKHIINANPDIEFDFYIQCWNLDLKDKLIDMYKPKGVLFEDNNIYRDEILMSLQKTGRPISDFGTTSQLLAISKSIKLALNTDIKYDYILCYRPDVLLWKDMKLNEYDNDKIYVNAMNNAVGDFHFVMNSVNAQEFCKIYETTFYNNVVTNSYLHGKIKLYVENFMNKTLLIDNIKPGQDQEVLRKLNRAITNNNLDIKNFYQYGLTNEEICSYNVE